MLLASRIVGFFGMQLRSGRIFMAANTQKLHSNARSEFYPIYEVKRFPVPDNKVSWSEDYPDYEPPDFTAPAVKNKPVWADPDIDRKNSNTHNMKFNKKDGLVNRVSFSGEYEVIDNVPRNPMGRTGLCGRGLLGKWGPNHAADPIVTRWKRDASGNIEKDKESGLPILQFVAIKRKDSGEWAIPGGMVDAGEKVSFTMKREFGEETLNTMKYSDEEKKVLEAEIAKLFCSGKEIYSGYVDDPRNTDNAWMETVAFNFHDEKGTSVSKLPLEAGDDAGAVRWMNISSMIKLYASHSEFLKKTAKKHNAHW